MKKALVLALIAILVVPQLLAESAAGRAESAATVLTDIMATPDKGIPEEILGSAKCVAVVPSLLKGGFVVGGSCDIVERGSRANQGGHGSRTRVATTGVLLSTAGRYGKPPRS